MGIKTIYVCEKCGKETERSTKGEQYFHVSILIQGVGTGYSNETRTMALWCRDCCDEYQLIISPQGTAKEPAPPELTIEDRLVAVFEAMGFERRQ